jgi:hypothetical protein
MLIRILFCVCLVVAVLAGVAVIEKRAQRRRSGRAKTSLTQKRETAVADAD